MSAPQPKSILKKPTASFPAGPSQSHSHAHAHASKPRVGSKLKHTVAVRADNDGPSKSRNTGQTKPKARIADHDDEDEDEDMSAEDEASDDDVSTGDEIERAKEKAGRKKAPTKRKAATTADTFGATLTSLLTEPAGGRAGPSKRQRKTGGEEGSQADTQATTSTVGTTKPSLPLPSSLSLSAPARGSAPILSLSRTTLPPSRKELSLERKAARILKAEKAEREDRARVKDVVEGWAHPGGGMEFEKGLRKTAQRGVIKLFNAILLASRTTEESLATQSLSVRAGLKAEKGKKGERDNELGRGGREELTKEGFLDLVRRGGR
ncbi:hypothetical protein JCM24511_01982 [Saitozyma sp. JCM 24511]|nr:hypothetical protein JCM24511_01982 [Saitozyma sp. JCM 24511]